MKRLTNLVPLTPTKPSEPILHDTVLPTDQVPWIIYYRKNLRKKMVHPTALSALAHESKPTQTQDTTKLNNNNLLRMMFLMRFKRT